MKTILLLTEDVLKCFFSRMKHVLRGQILRQAILEKPSKIKTLSSKIVTASNSAACGVWLEIGEQYLIGGSVDEKGVLHSYLCGTNQNWNDVSAKDKAALKTYQC
ncbi:hypothetical protein Y032_0846g2663 [Ancylostoma ceylanicum]|uniref:NTR domain-containing protein n=1 Tax=Ancylostoma ceylanicum TaxID=53326 RepID=A0A016WBA0_9BILA|nr:hypothetical protein Y032_0846g2663 [Ancylostoma ceylanicum]